MAQSEWTCQLCGWENLVGNTCANCLSPRNNTAPPSAPISSGNTPSPAKPGASQTAKSATTGGPPPELNRETAVRKSDKYPLWKSALLQLLVFFGFLGGLLLTAILVVHSSFIWVVVLIVVYEFVEAEPSGAKKRSVRSGIVSFTQHGLSSHRAGNDGVGQTGMPTVQLGTAGRETFFQFRVTEFDPSGNPLGETLVITKATLDVYVQEGDSVTLICFDLAEGREGNAVQVRNPLIINHTSRTITRYKTLYYVRVVLLSLIVLVSAVISTNMTMKHLPPWPVLLVMGSIVAFSAMGLADAIRKLRLAEHYTKLMTKDWEFVTVHDPAGVVEGVSTFSWTLRQGSRHWITFRTAIYNQAGEVQHRLVGVLPQPASFRVGDWVTWKGDYVTGSIHKDPSVNIVSS